jgi:tRNA (mo5U34)-methyltransferase
MHDFKALFDDLASIGLGSWRDQIEATLAERFSESAHGDLREWREVLSALPAVGKQVAASSGPAVVVPPTDGVFTSELREALQRLNPWRKGPFDICGVHIDAEWRSDFKWDRIKDEISPLEGRSILDVGCGNGYYALRMHGMGAKLVIGVEPTLLYVMQFLAVSHFIEPQPVHVLPFRLHELPQGSNAFDTVFSMGVLYHQRDPEHHLQQLGSSLRRGGELVLETLILPGSEPESRTPEDRYARMRNVWHLPTVPMLESWLEVAGFVDVRVLDISKTGPAEQRSTDWMPFESLAESLDPADPGKTVEGWPAPRRAAVLCGKP